MSLQRLAHRIATVAALRGRTLAGDAVGDSAIPPIDVTTGEGRQPFVAVYTDRAARSLRGLASGSPGGSLAIVVEIGVAARIGDGDDWEIPPTDAGFEFTLDVIERQVMIALADEESAWAEMWRRLHGADPEVESLCGRGAADGAADGADDDGDGDGDAGVRLAGRRIVIEVSPLAEPPCGPPAPPLWRDFLDLLAADDDHAPLEPTIRALIEASPAPDEWLAAMRGLLLTRPEADALGVAPPDGAEAGVVIQTVSAPDAGPVAP